MIKQIAALILISLVVTLTLVYDRHGIFLLIAAHDWVAQLLKDVFSGGHVGSLARELIALLVLPIGTSAVLAGLYYMVKRHWFPYFMEVVWVIWLIQVSAIVTLYAG